MYGVLRTVMYNSFQAPLSSLVAIRKVRPSGTFSSVKIGFVERLGIEDDHDPDCVRTDYRVLRPPVHTWHKESQWIVLRTIYYSSPPRTILS